MPHNRWCTLRVSNSLSASPVNMRALDRCCDDGRPPGQSLWMWLVEGLHQGGRQLSGSPSDLHPWTDVVTMVDLQASRCGWWLVGGLHQGGRQLSGSPSDLQPWTDVVTMVDL
ncbi:hypothetical protein RRG08_023319 [Elysia crispata]|uniref:Uncharacterized protein n=1 Tax=Elysia crispata TaxID=231223 RepID=A0AAE1BE33_9GAST|nr:hypothetical protein RRG08_023319 [Elysia crispata]